MILPRRFRRPRVLIVGCGDVGQRVARLLAGRVRVVALSSSREHAAALRGRGLAVLEGDLDDAASLHRLRGIASRVLHLAPPQAEGATDERTRRLLNALRGGAARRIVYGSTSGVYGDAQGARFDETRLPAPRTPRAARRFDAEQQLRAQGRCAGMAVSVLRIPGIYAADREGGLPLERLKSGLPVIAPPHDVYTNHVHADDLARACVLALWRGRPQRIVHACDDTELVLGDYLDLAAAHFGLPPPPRIALEDAAARLTPMRLSFLSESRRLDNTRLKRELGLRLRYATVQQGWPTAGMNAEPAPEAAHAPTPALNTAANPRAATQGGMA